MFRERIIEYEETINKLNQNIKNLKAFAEDLKEQVGDLGARNQVLNGEARERENYYREESTKLEKTLTSFKSIEGEKLEREYEQNLQLKEKLEEYESKYLY